MEMAKLLGLFVVLGVVWSAAFFEWSAMVWTAAIGATLLFMSAAGFLPVIAMLIFWPVYIAAAMFANLRKERQERLVVPMVPKLQKQMPTISATEQAAIDAGDTWWEKELFCGRPNWKKLYALPKPTLSAEEQSFLDIQVDHLCSMINDFDIVFREHDLPERVYNYLKSEKFFGMVIPKKYGGLGFSALAHSTVITKIATRSVSAAVTTMVPNSLGPGELLLHYGTDAQKDYYLPRLADGREIPCFALTGPDAGSDAGAIPDKGIVCRDKFEDKTVLGIRLSWDKRYITLAPIATVLGLAIHLYDPEHLLGEQEDVGITLCLIPTSHEGVEIGSRHFPMQLAFMNGPTRGNDVFIPLEWIIGGVGMAGQGWRMLMECLSIGRSISLPALSTGCAKVTYRLTGAYSRIRRQFNAPIANFEGIEEALSYIAGYTYTLEACRIMTAGAIDLNINPSIVSAIAKYQMTEMCRNVVSHGMDIHGGHMIQAGPRNFLANIYNAIPLSITVEGANILTRNLIIFGQGAIRCHPYILREVALLTEPKTDINALDNTLMSHVGYCVSNIMRSFAYGITGGLFIFTTTANKRVAALEKQLTRMSTALAMLSDVSLILLGGSLKRRERISARLGDILSQLYLASAVLKYFHDNKNPPEDVNSVCWSLEECLHKIQIACNQLLNNFPQRWLGKLMRFIIFPLGNAYRTPRDELQNAIIAPMLTSSALRDRLTQNCYISHEQDELGSRLDAALAQVIDIDPLYKKLQKAVQAGTVPAHYSFEERVTVATKAGILTHQEAQSLRHYESLRNEIIKVNEFSFNLDEVIA